MEGILRGLQERGARVDCIVPENSVWELSDLEPKHDLYVLKSETPLALSLAGALTVAGGEVLNATRAVNLVRDKLAATAVLAASGVPVPASYATGSAALLQPLLETGPLWLKPNRGTKGTGIQRLSLPGELDPSLQCQDPYGLPLPFFAQREFPSSGRDFKVYVVGEKVWATERPFPATSDAEKVGRAAKVPPNIREAALACGKALSLEIYGVDFLVSEDRFAVVDVNSFPGYKGVEEAPEALADYIHRRALSARKGKGKLP
jgi:ribosomal protein S6--L-glutamate ligase